MMRAVSISRAAMKKLIPPETDAAAAVRACYSADFQESFSRFGQHKAVSGVSYPK